MPEIKKIRTEDEVDESSNNEKEIKQQNKIMFKYRDQLKKYLNKKELQELLEANEQEIPSGIESVRIYLENLNPVVFIFII